MTDRRTDWLQLHWPTWIELAWGVGLFAAFAAASALATGLLLVKLPADYFAGPSPPDFWHGRHPVLRLCGRVLRNLLGVLLVAAGIAMLFLPGQGLLTILIGLMLLDLPGKRELERRLVRRPKVLQAINALRRRYGKPDLIFEVKSRSADAAS